MIKQFFLLILLFSLFGCGESQEDKVVAFCMNNLNKYQANNVTKAQCSCFYQEVSQQLSESDIDEMTKDPFGSYGPLLNKAEANFVILGANSKCFK